MSQRNTLPQHKDPASDDRRAVAPYNFVPLPNDVLKVQVGSLPDHDIYQGHTGHFTCTIETSSPTYVRGMSLVDAPQESQENPEFFSLNSGKTPMLPGSSLRGMIRNLMEIVTHAKFEMTSKNPLVYRSVGDTTSHGIHYRERIMRTDAKNSYTPQVRGGYMRWHNGQWWIQPAIEIGETTTTFCRIPINKIPKDLTPWGECKNARTIYATPGPYQYQDVRGGFLRIRYAKTLRANQQPAPGLHKCALVYSGRMLKKNTEAIIFPPDERSDKWWLIEQEMELNYRDQISKEQQALLGNQGLLQDGQPLFYLVEESKLVFFGHTMMMRMTYKNAPYDLVPENLRRETDTDMVEALFGYTKKQGKGKAKAYAGRLSFSDARCLSSGNVFEQIIQPKILATPKPTTFQHYLVQPEPNDKTKLQDYEGGQTALRGHKMYWHKGNLSVAQIQESDLAKLREDQGKPFSKRQYRQIRPVKSGIKFQFTLRFENLSDEELGALAWVLKLGEDPRYRFKLGMGKPLGMGAISLQSQLHLGDRANRYRQLWQGDGWETGEKESQEVEMAMQKGMQAFQKWVLGSAVNPKKVTDLKQLDRIRDLLDMLSWPGPDPAGTRYMEIERKDSNSKTGKRNEYKERPVLPTPNTVLRLHKSAAVTPSIPAAQSRPSSHPAGPTPKPATTPTKAQPSQQIADPQTADDLKKGMYLQGKIVKVESSRLVVDIGVAQGAIAKDKVFPLVPFLDEHYRVGQTIYVWYEGKNQKGNHQLSMKK